MSRRRGEFEHRTSIFEGAFRAWSHLGGLEPEDLEEKPTAELDPLSNPIENDARLTNGNNGEDAQQEILNPNGTKRRIFPYEPLPRSGLAHPYVQAILCPWLGPDADNDAIQLGLTTLRTWWQHRRKGESGSAIAALGTEKMKGVIEGYTRHFFALAHCLVMNDKEQPPRTLQTKMKELEKKRNKSGKKKGIDTSKAMAAGVTNIIAADLTNDALSPLERLHVAQQRNLGADSGISAMQSTGGIDPANPPINVKNKCVPTKVNLPAIVDAVNRQANQLAHSGALQSIAAVTNSMVSGAGMSGNASNGDPDSFPIVFVAGNGDMLLALSVDGITCAHCVKIVETVLKGCNGNKSPIDGLLDAAADRDLNSVLVKLDRLSAAKRVAFESARNLAMVGYTAKAKAISVLVDQGGASSKIPDSIVQKACKAVGESDPKVIFDWNMPCSCPDNGVLRGDCSRHSQMGIQIFEAFEHRGMQVQSYLVGAAIEPATDSGREDQSMLGGHRGQELLLNDEFHPRPISMVASRGLDMFLAGSGMTGNMNMGGNNGMRDEHRGMQVQGYLVGAAVEPSTDGGRDGQSMPGGHQGQEHLLNDEFHPRPISVVPNRGLDMFFAGSGVVGNMNMGGNNGTHDGGISSGQRAKRNSSITLFGGRALSIGDASYGRAMSGLSALSIDWENMDDFDLNVDHSAHINNDHGMDLPTTVGDSAGKSSSTRHHAGGQR